MENQHSEHTPKPVDSYRAGMPQVPREHSRKRQLILLAFALVVVLGISLFVYLIMGLPDLTELENVNPAQASRIFSADGKVIHELFIQSRIWISYDRIPQHVIEATLDTEDRVFYDHWGVHIQRIVKPIIVNLFSLSYKQGFSTISMQVARNLYVKKIGFEQSIFRKLREILTAIEIERTYAKNEILEMYLNVSYFGRGAYGIQSASQKYFGKDADKLTLEEGALLVGLLKGPGYYAPEKYADRALLRRNVVLHNMTTCKHLTPAEFDSLKQLPLATAAYTSDNGIAPYFTEYVRQQLNELQRTYLINDNVLQELQQGGMELPALNKLETIKQLEVRGRTEFLGLLKSTLDETEYDQYKNAILEHTRTLNFNVYEDGLNIYTTLNTAYQKAAEEAIARQMPEIQQRVKKSLLAWKKKNEVSDSTFEKKSEVQIAFIAVDHHNGHILAMIGGRDFNESKFNRATQAKRQPGSTFKPFLYAAAIDNGYTPVDKLWNQPIVLWNPDGTRWTPENFDKSLGGETTLREGLRKSLNLIAAHLIDEIGPRAVVDYAKRMGISTEIHPYHSLAMGSSDVIPLDMVSAFGVFANQGVRVEPVSIIRVEDRYGNILYESHSRRTEALNSSTAYIMTNMLQDVIDRGTGGSVRWRFQFHAPAAGKTGTTNDYTDAWFIGFTPLLTAGVWVGLDDQALKLGAQGTGTGTALPFWADFMKTLYDSLGLPKENFRQPPDVVTADVCIDSGELATNFCPNVARNEVFRIKDRPTTSCHLHPGALRRGSKVTAF